MVSCCLFFCSLLFSLILFVSFMLTHVTLVPGQSFVLLHSTPPYEYTTSLVTHFPFEGLPFFFYHYKQKMLLRILYTLKPVSGLMPSNRMLRYTHFCFTRKYKIALQSGHTCLHFLYTRRSYREKYHYSFIYFSPFIKNLFPHYSFI